MITLDDLEGRATITVPEAGQVLGIGRDAAYAAAERGEIPVLHLGRRLVVPVPRLLQLLGYPQTDSEPGPSTGPGTALGIDPNAPGVSDEHRTHPNISASSNIRSIRGM